MHMLSLSQDMKKESGDWTVYVEISIILKFMKRLETPGIIFKKYGMPRRKSTAWWWFLCCFGWNGCWYTSKYKEMELGMDCLISRILLATIAKLCASPRLISQVLDISGQNIKIKCLMCQISITLWCKFELKLIKLKDLFI